MAGKNAKWGSQLIKSGNLEIQGDAGNAKWTGLVVKNTATHANGETDHGVEISMQMQAYEAGSRDYRPAARIIAVKGTGNDWFTGSASANFQGQLYFQTRQNDVLQTGLQIDNGGRIQMPYQPSAMVKLNNDNSQGGQYNTVGPTGTLATAIATIKYETVVYDVGNNYSTSSGRFTCPVAGRYLVTANSNVNMGSATGVTFHELYKNGSVYIRAYDAYGYQTNTWYQNSITAVVDCNTNDYIEIKLRCNSGLAWADSDTQYTQASFILLN